MNRHIFIRTILAFALVCVCGQAYTQEVTQKDLRELEQRVEKKVKDGNETLAVAKSYSEKADKLHESFLYHMDLKLAFFGLLIALFLAGGFWATKKAMQSQFERKLTQYGNQLEMVYQQKLGQIYTDNEKIIDRMFANEIDTYELKKQADILFIHQTNSQSQDEQFGELQAVIQRRFVKTKSTHSTGLNSITDNIEFEKLKKENSPFKLLVMNDDLFDTERNVPKNEADVHTFFKELNDADIGLALFGEAYLKKYGLNYLAFANNPYSVYTNINNLLKYMNAIKN